MIENNFNNHPPAPRLPLKMDINYRRNYARQNDLGSLKNISITGAFLETDQTILMSLEEKLTVRFEVSGREREIHAKVVWKNELGCGIEFQPDNNRDVQIVDDLMYFVESKKESKKDVLDIILNKVSNS
ncbi:MAG: PilZ domain-containing protein [Bdellovibrionaceae bacterium]|jgi:hypothetical protein|nr:PilZ domain-containing protein [Pseudobdellovibrionaceae bacterium]